MALPTQGWGKTIILGVEMHGAPLTISSLEILHGKCVMGSQFGGVKPKQDIPILADKYLNKVTLIRLTMRGTVDVRELLIQRIFPCVLFCRSWSWISS